MVQYSQVEDEARVPPDDLAEITLDAFEKLPAFAHIISVPDYRYICVNAAARYAMISATDGDPDKMVGSHPWELSPWWKELFLLLYEEVRASRLSRLIHDFCCDISGQTSYWDLLLVPNVAGDTDEVASITTIGFNVTDRVLAERSLTDSESLLRIAANTVPYTFTIYDSRLRVMFASRTALERTGYTEQDVIGRTDEELFPPEAIERYMPALRRAVATGTKQTVELSQYEGSRPVVITASFVPILDGEGRVTQVVSIAYDISEHKRLESLSDALSTINTAINSTLDFDAVMRRALDQSAKAIGADTAVTTLREGDDWVVRYVYGAPQDIVGNHISADDAGIPRLVEASREVMAICNAAEDDRLDQDVIGRYGIRSILALPLISKDQVIGAMVFRFMSKQMDFTCIEIDWAGKLAASISMALENTRLFQDLQQAFDRERKIADELQKALVPAISEAFDDYVIKTFYQPAYALQIGGDFYDVFRTETGRIAVLIGDVSGRGIEAAAVASAARNTLRAFAYEMHSPGRALRRANSVLSAQVPLGKFITAFLALIDPGTGMLTYSSAGHPPAIICRPGGCADFLGCGNVPLGLLAKGEFREAKDRIARGCRIVFYTDGLSEARRPEGFLGIEGILEAMSSHASLSADKFVGMLLGLARREVDGQSDDDTAIIVLDRM